jgi:Tfp pilus assembly PilM family ATPase
MTSGPRDRSRLARVLAGAAGGRAGLRWGRPGGRQVLGLDIGADVVRMALLEKRRGKLSVLWTEPISLTELKGFADFDAVGARLAAVLHARGAEHVEVAAMPPWSSGRVSIEEMPAMGEQRLRKAARWYAERAEGDDPLAQVHHAIPQATRPGQDGAAVMDAMLISIDRVMLDGLDEMCRRLSLRLRWVVPQPLCAAAVLPLDLRGRPVLVVDVGAAQTRMALVVDGSVRLVRKLSACANDTVKAVAQSSDLSWEDASAAVRAAAAMPATGTPGAGAPSAAAVRAAGAELKRLAKSLGEEIERSAAYVAARHRAEVQAVLLTGGLGGSPALNAALRERVTLPLRALDAAQSALLRGARAREPFGSDCALACGAALLALTGGASINLMARGRRPAGREAGARAGARAQLGLRAVLRSRWAAAAAVLALAVTGSERQLVRVQTSARARLAALQTQAENLDVLAQAASTRDAAVDLRDRLAALQRVYRQRTVLTPLLARIVASLPDEVWLTAMGVERTATAADSTAGDAGPAGADGAEGTEGAPAAAHVSGGAGASLALHLSGRARRVEPIAELVVSLESNALLSRIQALDIREELVGEPGRQSRVFTFEIQAVPARAADAVLVAGGAPAANGVQVAHEVPVAPDAQAGRELPDACGAHDTPAR